MTVIVKKFRQILAKLKGVERDPYCEIAIILGQVNLLQKLFYLRQIFIVNTGDMAECNDLLFNTSGGLLCRWQQAIFSTLTLIQ